MPATNRTVIVSGVPNGGSVRGIVVITDHAASRLAVGVAAAEALGCGCADGRALASGCLAAGGRRPGLAGAGILLAGADLLPVGRDFRQQVNQVSPLGGVERRQEGVGCAGERGGRLALRAPAAGGQVDEERAAVLRA